MHRSLFLPLQFILLFLLFNPFFLMLLSAQFNSYDLQRIIALAILGVSALQFLCDRDVRQQTMQILENFCTYTKCLLFGFFGLRTDKNKV